MPLTLIMPAAGDPVTLDQEFHAIRITYGTPNADRELETSHTRSTYRLLPEEAISVEIVDSRNS